MNNWREILSWQMFDFYVLRKEDPRLEKANGAHFVHEIDIDYSTLIEKLGPPTYPDGDNYKTDAEWVIYFPDVDNVVTIYNWKDGKNYLGEEGLDKEDITEWHIGAHNSEYVDKIYELLMIEK